MINSLRGVASMERFSYINNSVTDRDLILYYVNRAGSGEVKSNFNIERGKLYPYCVIHYVTKGFGHVTCRGKDYDISQGDLFILNAYEGHHYFTDKDNLLELNWIEFAGGDAVKLITAILKNGEPIIKSLENENINSALNDIFKLIKENNRDNEFLISKIIYSMLLNLLYMNKIDIHNNSSHSGLENISKVIYFIENNLGESISILMLSRICAYSPTYFAKLFYKIMGNTPMNYVLGKRINKAKEFLSKSSVTVEHLAQILGFSSPSHFIRRFKKLEGLTPSEYRKQSLMFKE